MTDYQNFVYPAGLIHANTLKLQPDKTWLDYAKKVSLERGTEADKSTTAEEAAEFLWSSIRSAIDMLSAKKTYDEYILETALEGLPKWAQIEEKTWNKLNEDVVLS